jgi:hypothetical protein
MASPSSYSRIEPSALESVRILPSPIPNLVISVELSNIPELLKLEAAQQMMKPKEMGPHSRTSTGMLLDIFANLYYKFCQF